MLVRVELVGLPELRKAAGAREISLELRDGTLGGLLRELEERHGLIARESLRSPDGRQVAQSIQVLRNGNEWLPREDLGTPLRSGDRITFMLMVAGG